MIGNLDRLSTPNVLNRVLGTQLSSWKTRKEKKNRRRV